MNAALNNVTKKFGELKQDVGHKAWLAGLGAYSKGVEEFNGLTGKGRTLVDDLSGKGRTLINELVERGTEVERVAKERITATATQTSSNIEERFRALEERVREVVAKVTGLDAESLKNFDCKIQQLKKQV